MYNINEIVDRIVENIKRQLNEGLSHRLWHFCPIGAMYSIAKKDQFKLTSIEKRPSDTKMTSLPTGNGKVKQYQYYMCFSRTPSSLVGYVSMRRDKTGGVNWKQSLVRIEVDGEKLNRNYKGMPVNYFNDKNLDKINHFLKDGKGKDRETFDTNSKERYSKQMDVKSLDDKGNIRTKTLQRYNPYANDNDTSVNNKNRQVSVDYGVIDRNQMHEYEDRLMSNKEYITGIKEWGIIKRIDIFLNNSILSMKNDHSKDILYMVDEIISVFGNIVHIFNNFSSFENVNTVNSISGYDFKKQYLEINQQDYNKTHDKINPENIDLLPNELKTLVRYAVILGFFGFGNGWKRAAYNNTKSILGDIGIDVEQYGLKEIISSFIKQIESCGENFFKVQTNYLKKELELIPPYKLEQYVSGLERIKGIEERMYALRTGKRVGILTTKINMCE